MSGELARCRRKGPDSDDRPIAGLYTTHITSRLIRTQVATFTFHQGHGPRKVPALDLETRRAFLAAARDRG